MSNKKNTRLRDILYRLIDDTVAVCKKMHIYSCCSGAMGSESYIILGKMLILLLNITKNYNDAVLYDYLEGFIPDVDVVGSNGEASNYKYDKRLNMCKLLDGIDRGKLKHNDDDFIESFLPSKNEDIIYVKSGSITEINKFGKMIKLLNECIYCV